MDVETAAASFVDLFHELFLRFHERQAAGERGLSLEAIAVLEHLSATGPLAVNEAARHFGRSQAATSEILARLEGRGLLVRYPDERDRRRNLVWLSEEGLAAWRRSRRMLDPSLLADAFAQLSNEQRCDTIAVLRRLLHKRDSSQEENENG